MIVVQNGASDVLGLGRGSDAYALWYSIGAVVDLSPTMSDKLSFELVQPPDDFFE